MENNNSRPPQKDKTPIILIIFGGLSFIPAIGIFFGVISIIISLFKFKRFKTLFILGISGILFSVTIYSALYYYGFQKRGGTYDKLRVVLNVELLKELETELSSYKLKFGHFPYNLNELKKQNNQIQIVDPISDIVENNKKDSLFYYQKTDSSFILFSKGFDWKPFTKDDISASDKIPTIK